MCLPGFTEVNVDVDQAWAGDQTAGIDLLCALLLFGGKPFDEPAVDNEEIAGFVSRRGRVDDASVADPERGHETRMLIFAWHDAFGLTTGTQIKHRHADRYSVRDLLENHTAFAIR